jgi:hypothetical protein
VLPLFWQLKSLLSVAPSPSSSKPFWQMLMTELEEELLEDAFTSLSSCLLLQPGSDG